MESRLCNLNEIASGSLDPRTLAHMIVQALADFYEMIPLSPDAVLDLIVDEMHIAGTECHNPLVALVDEAPVAVICAYPLAELASRQRGSLLQIIRRLDHSGRKALRQMVTESLSIAEIEAENARYIARIAVANSMRGRGIGTKIFYDFVAIDPNRPIALHVDRRNDGGIAFYRDLGFQFSGSKDVSKLAMIWHG